MDRFLSLQSEYTVLDLDGVNKGEVGSAVLERPLLLLGDTRKPYPDIVKVLQNAAPQQILHIVPLIPVESDIPRLVASGYVTELAREALTAAGVNYLGEEPLHALNYRTLENALFALQTALTAEAVSLGISVGLDPELLYNAIAGAAGTSWSYRKFAPSMLSLGEAEIGFQSLKEAKSALSEALYLGKSLAFYSPMFALSKQLYELAGRFTEFTSSSATIAKLWSAKSQKGSTPTPQVDFPAPIKPQKIGFIGLGAMGYGMANVLRNAGQNVIGHDVWAPSMDRYIAGGGICANSLEECATDAQVFVLMVVNAAQAGQVLFQRKAAEALPPNAVILLMSTVSPSEAVSLHKQLQQVRSDITLIDSPVSGGTGRAATGDLTILAAGLEQTGSSIPQALSVLSTLSTSQGKTENLIFVPGGPGMGAAVKLVNQHLAGCHISSTAEALAFASRLDLPLRQTRALLLSGPAQSWMMGHRGKHMLDGLIQPPTSMIDIFVKDMNIVVSEGEALHSAVPLAAHVQQQFILGKANGWGADDDSSLVRLWNQCGINVVCPE